MANKTSPNSFILAWLLRARLTLRSGFTLIELLIAVVVGSIIISTMLYLVVELLQINRREEVLTQTQQDMRRALDYISRDAGEAVYIYSSPYAAVDTGGTTLLSQISDFPTTAVPVLAFWRLDPIDPSDPNAQALFNKNCSTFSASGQEEECKTLKVRQGYYTLVIYAQQPNGNNTIWGGKSRIVRYELPRYTSANLPNLLDTAGYAEPTGKNNSFAKWKKGGGNTDGNLVVLTDYLDAPVAGNIPACPPGVDKDNNPVYRASPVDKDNFYACVRQGTTIEKDGLTTGSNQTLVVFLRGNATAEKAGFVTFSEAGRLPTLKSEVLIRGVLDKQPEDL